MRYYPKLVFHLQTQQAHYFVVYPFLLLFSFFFCALGVNDVPDVQCHEVGQIAEGGGELVIMESVDVADDVVGEAGYLLDISHEKQPCRGGGPVYDFLQVDGG